MVDLKLNPLELEQARLNEIAEGLTAPSRLFLRDAIPLANLALFAL